MAKFIATHILKKDFTYKPGEIYKKGSPVFIPPAHRKHFGFCCNVFFLKKNGYLLINKDKVVSAFSKDFFIPRSSWFAKI